VSLMTVWKCSAENCNKDADVIAAGTSLCKAHGAQVAGLLNALLMVTYQKETAMGLEEEERRTMDRMAIEEELKKKQQEQKIEEERKLVQGKLTQEKREGSGRPDEKDKK
jgi:hypothetical protein